MSRASVHSRISGAEVRLQALEARRLHAPHHLRQKRIECVLDALSGAESLYQSNNVLLLLGTEPTLCIPLEEAPDLIQLVLDKQFVQSRFRSKVMFQVVGLAQDLHICRSNICSL